MVTQHRTNWSHQIDQIIRSKHYTWLGEGLGGEPHELALTTMLVDIQHICKRRGIAWDQLLQKSRAQFEQEECEQEQVFCN